MPRGKDRLATYRSMRNFAVTAEPSGLGEAPAPGHRFVVQRHRASSLHYDFRLEAAEVLLSWAVPRGPTLDPDVKRMAIQTEDHPLSYYDFEGAIPAKEYGGGDVIVWDWGTWSDPTGADPIDAMESGTIHVDLDGEKLKGQFMLIRTGRGSRSGPKSKWLLFHKHDEHAAEGWDAEDHPRSVKSGRTNDEVKDAPSATWSGTGNWAAPTPDELDALDDLGTRGTWTIGDHSVRLTNLDKVLFPARGRGRGLAKRDLVRHHAVMAPAMLPYLHDRPVNLHRYTDGAGAKGFWQRVAPRGTPDFVPHTSDHLILDSPGALVWAAQIAALELHPWTSTAKASHRPTWALIDIDPGTKASFDDVLVLARLYRAALDHLELEACPKVTGKRGLQIWVPVAEGYEFRDTADWVEKLSRAVGKTVPDMVSWEWKVADRKGLTRLDYTQNAINKTLVAPFSARALAGAPVSVPITWDELDDPDLTPDRWTIVDAAARVRDVGDPLAPLIGLQQRLPKI